MDYSIIGFPRIGARRELKFATEKYFRGEISAEELKNTVAAQREAQWKLQKDAGVSYIPSNDYSLYDGVLDASFMLNAIPARYTSTGLSDLDVYFAMAHGYQGEKGDVKAFTMKKWFNTNYHYMVPELDDDMTIKLRSEALVDAYRQAEALGIKTKPVVVGPFTFLKLAKTTGAKTKAEFLPAILNAYEELLGVCNSLGAEWLQLDEPSLVTDLTADEIALFVSIYEKLLAKKGSLRVLAQTYFGDVRDCYKELCALNFDAIGLDFVEGKRSAELVADNGFPADKILFAGVVNGKNIWRCNYKTALDKVNVLRAYAKQIVLNTSCSLLHVPYTISNESKLDANVIKFFAFAVEKLVELKELGRIIKTTPLTSPTKSSSRRTTPAPTPTFRVNSPPLPTPISSVLSRVRNVRIFSEKSSISPSFPPRLSVHSRRPPKSVRIALSSERAKSPKKRTALRLRISSASASLFRKKSDSTSSFTANLNATTWSNSLARISTVTSSLKTHGFSLTVRAALNPR